MRNTVVVVTGASAGIGAALAELLSAQKASVGIIARRTDALRAVADWLQDRGVPLERIAVLPSHAGAPGAAATAERRRWWNSVQREVGDFGNCSPRLIGRWVPSEVGPLDQPPQDISGGTWRELHHARDSDWPAIVPAWERRKYLVSVRGQSFLVKFAGLGRIGEEKLAMAGALHLDGLVPEPIGLVHGFLVERWCEEAKPLPAGEKPLPEIAHYIATRAKLLPAATGSGASIEELLRMGRRNISLEFGDELAHGLGHWERRASDLEQRIVRVRTDNKLDRHEWLRTPSGALLKTDALDHYQGHDLIGCQDVAWDMAGAITEIDLDQEQGRELANAVERRGVRVDRELLDFYRVAYLAFRLGRARLGMSMTADASERQRIERRGDRYAAELELLLERSWTATRPQSLVG